MGKCLQNIVRRCYICRVKIIHFSTMLYNFYPKFKCQYDDESLLVFGAFYNERPSWHFLRDSKDFILEALEKIPQKADEDKSKLIYRLKGREGNKTRFTYQKIRRLARPWDGEKVFKAIREDLIPD